MVTVTLGVDPKSSETLVTELTHRLRARRGRASRSGDTVMLGSCCLRNISHDPGSGVITASTPVESPGAKENTECHKWSKGLEDAKVVSTLQGFPGAGSCSIFNVVSGSLHLLRQKRKPLKSLLQGKGRIVLCFMSPALAAI